MYYTIIRILMWALLSVLCFFVVRASRIIHKRKIIMLCIFLSGIVTAVTMVFPIENMFISFDTPEAVFRYTKTGELYDRIDGYSSSMLIYENSKGTFSHFIVPKAEEGYIIPTSFSEKTLVHQFNTDGFFEIYTLRGTQDYYLFTAIGADAKNAQIEIRDETGMLLSNKIVKINGSGFVFLLLPDVTQEYYLTVDGNEIILPLPKKVSHND